ncbi:MAG TPA: response regulator transcription factor [Pseudonocardiaceae bacterium]|nr:response regulator transcription factor [Pseudonocardiaceae bacterium]
MSHYTQLMEGLPLRVVLVDDHEMVRTGLKAMLSRFARQVRVVGEAADAATARRVVAGLDPDIVLADVRLGGENGLDLCRDLLRDSPSRRVVLLTVYDDEQYLFQAMQAGAAGYLLKRIDGPELVTQLQRVHAGGVVVDPGLAARAGASADRLQAGGYWPGARLGLTQRESEVLSLMAAGSPNRAIAAKLFVGEETVKSHIRGIYRKLGVTDRAAAVATALREGLFR